MFLSFTFHHIGHLLAARVEQRLDVEKVGGENEFEERALIDLEELAVPLRDCFGALARHVVAVLFGQRCRIALVILGPLDHLFLFLVIVAMIRFFLSRSGAKPFAKSGC